MYSLENTAQEFTAEKAAPQRRKEAAEEKQPRLLPAGQWLRAVLNFDAPFGHDGLPTVWG